MTGRIRPAVFFVCLFFIFSGAGDTGAQETGVGQAGVNGTPEVSLPPGTETPSRNAVPGTAGGAPAAGGIPGAAEGAAGTTQAGTAASGGPLPRSYRETSLGMSLEDLKAGLARDEIINFRGDRDVSFLPSREQTLVETAGFSFIRRAFFQLRDGKVFIMAYALNTRLVDHYSVFTVFTEKYGEPAWLDPKQAVWENEDTRIAIERPLTVKYIDKTVFSGIVNESALIESAGIRRRQEFLDDF
ncbi:MAG: hypothetical protein LBS06_02695 [Treponema sp.]|nr:hypothetical protein [Treponema sp.]